MKIKVLIVISNMEFGGAQRQVVELVNNIDKNKFEIHVCSLSEYTPLASQLNKKIKFHIVNKKKKFDLLVICKLISILKHHKIDIIHSYLFDAEIASRLAAFFSFSKVKVIGSERNTSYHLKSHQKIASIITKRLVKLIIANSTSGAEFNAKLNKLNKDKYKVIYNGVDTKKFFPSDRNKAKQYLKIAPDYKVIGIFASFKEQKNHPLLLSAFSEILPDNPKIMLLLVGDMLHGGMHGSSDFNKKILQLIQSLNIQENCLLLGNRNDVEHLYPACDFTVLPSLYEGTPNVVLESMACGSPVIATNVSDNAKIIINNKNGIIFESKNKEQLKAAMCKLLNSDILESMGVEARKTVLYNFSSKSLALKTQTVYEEVSQEHYKC